VLYFAAIDIRKSFDTINQKKLFEIVANAFAEVKIVLPVTLTIVG
jgi:hypothetical protein